MKPLLLLAAVACIAACKRAAPPADPTPTLETVSGVEMIHYDSEDGTFSILAPKHWGAQEEKGTLTFVGPRDPKTMAYSYITILPSSPQWTDARKYAESFWQIDPKIKQPDIEERKIGDATVLFFHQDRPNRMMHNSSRIGYMLRYDYALIPVKGGFYEFEHRAPVNTYAATLPVFESVVKSFKPKPKP